MRALHDHLDLPALHACLTCLFCRTHHHSHSPKCTCRVAGEGIPSRTLPLLAGACSRHMHKHPIQQIQQTNMLTRMNALSGGLCLFTKKKKPCARTTLRIQCTMLKRDRRWRGEMSTLYRDAYTCIVHVHQRSHTHATQAHDGKINHTMHGHVQLKTTSDTHMTWLKQTMTTKLMCNTKGAKA